VEGVQLANEQPNALEHQHQCTAAVELEQLHCTELESCCCRMEAEVEQEHDRAELENYQAWESEHCKWKAREERLLEQLQPSQQQSSGSLVSDRQPSREVRENGSKMQVLAML